jgi:hypothetical protein
MAVLQMVRALHLMESGAPGFRLNVGEWILG